MIVVGVAPARGFAEVVVIIVIIRTNEKTLIALRRWGSARLGSSSVINRKQSPGIVGKIDWTYQTIGVLTKVPVW